MKDNPKKSISDHIELAGKLHNDPDFHNRILQMYEICLAAFKNDQKILFCGNGGSAADAQHIAAELSGKFNLDREPLFAEALHVNTSYLTAVANDYGFKKSFSRLVKAKGRKGDVLIGLSTSGNSKNVILAFEEAEKIGMQRIGWTGEDGGLLKNKTDLCFCIPSKETPRIQEMHILLGHILCDMIEKSMFG